MIAYYEQRKLSIFFVVLLSCNFKLGCLATVQCTLTCLQHGPGDVETLALREHPLKVFITALPVGSALIQKGAPCEFLYYGLDFKVPLTEVQSYSPSIAGPYLVGQMGKLKLFFFCFFFF